MEALMLKLVPLSLRVLEMPADGHCLYRSLAHQMQRSGYTEMTFQHCRRLSPIILRVAR